MEVMVREWLDILFHLWDLLILNLYLLMCVERLMNSFKSATSSMAGRRDLKDLCLYRSKNRNPPFGWPVL